ncbi:hypothetical protein ACFL55_03435 [Candidatus Latescibacterota bacterium]
MLVNSNPATIMTDPRMADVTYIEPLTPESIAKIIELERPDALLPNLGGQTGLNATAALSRNGVLEKYGVEIIGVKADAIERGEDRIAFKETMAKLEIPVPRSKACNTVVEHIELAGIHSGDSACVIPSRTIRPEHLETVEKFTDMIAKELNVVGIINIQYAVYKDRVYILEANPRASRTVPVISKVLGIILANIATKLMIGAKLKDIPELVKRKVSYIGVKEAVFPFNMFPEVDPLLGPEMRATGEVMGIADTFGIAFYKAQLSTGAKLPTSGNVLLTVNNRDKQGLLPVAKRLAELGFMIVATEGTSVFLSDRGAPNTRINKLAEGRPNILDAIKDHELHLIINTPLGRDSKDDDSFIWMEAIQHKIPYVTTIAAAKASVEGIEAVINRGILPVSLQEYYRR